LQASHSTDTHTDVYWESPGDARRLGQITWVSGVGTCTPEKEDDLALLEEVERKIRGKTW
jgi:hypothetical protein